MKLKDFSKGQDFKCQHKNEVFYFSVIEHRKLTYIPNRKTNKKIFVNETSCYNHTIHEMVFVPSDLDMEKINKIPKEILKNK